MKKKTKSSRARRTQFHQRESLLYHATMAHQELRRGRVEEAERQARWALRIEPGDYDATQLLGLILTRSGRKREALTLLHEALHKRPKDPVLLYNLACCAFEVGRLQEARRAILKFNAVVERDPGAMPVRRAEYQKALRQLLRAIETKLSRGSEGAEEPAAVEGARSSAARVRPMDPRQVSLFSESMSELGEDSAAAAPVGSAPGAELASMPQVPPPARASVVGVPAHPPRVEVRFEEAIVGTRRAGAEASWMEDPWSDDLEERELLLEAHRIRLLIQYEELLCLPTLTGVEKFDYQIETARKILRRLNGRALLCDEVGLGKTIEAGMVIKEYLLRGLARSVLVLVPSGLVRQWREEMYQKFGLEFALWDEPRDAGQASDPLLALGSIAVARHRRNIEAFSEREWDLVVVDEAHHLRRRSTRSWALVNSLRKRFLLLLSATPVHNNLMELYELVTLVRPGLLGTRGEFRRKFLDGDGGRSGRDPAPLREALAEVMVRNTRSQAGIALPRRFATTLVLEPSPTEGAAYGAASEYARLLYPGADPSVRIGLRHLLGCAGSGPQALAEAAARRLAGSTAVDNAGPEDEAASPRDPAPQAEEARRLLGEIAGAARAAQGSVKAERLLEMVASSEEQMVVFCRYRATLAGLSERLAKASVAHVLYHGGLPRAEKEAAIGTFRDGARVLLSTESGGEGRNIQFCRTIVNYDLPWDPMQIEQRIGRVHRIGQRRDVFVFNLVLAGTLEEEILRILEEKIHLFELVVGEVDSILGHLERREEFADIVLGLWAGSGDAQERRRRFEEFGAELTAARAAYQEQRSLDEALFEDHLEA